MHWTSPVGQTPANLPSILHSHHSHQTPHAHLHAGSSSSGINSSRSSSSSSRSDSSPSSSGLGALDRGVLRQCRGSWRGLGLVSEARYVSDLHLFLVFAPCHGVDNLNFGFFYTKSVLKIRDFFIESCSHYQKEAIKFSEILAPKTGVWPICRSQNPYMCEIRQSACENLFVLIQIIHLYTKEDIPMISRSVRKCPKKQADFDCP